MYREKEERAKQMAMLNVGNVRISKQCAKRTRRLPSPMLQQITPTKNNAEPEKCCKHPRDQRVHIN